EGRSRMLILIIILLLVLGGGGGYYGHSRWGYGGGAGIGLGTGLMILLVAYLLGALQPAPTPGLVAAHPEAYPDAEQRRLTIRASVKARCRNSERREESAI